MPGHDLGFRPFPRFRLRRPARRRAGLGAEFLESRWLLASSTINVAPGLTFAIALPVPGLATGMGLPSTTSPSLQSAAAGISPGPVASPFGPSATGPSTTLSPLMNDSETANAPASQVARPTPGRSDRISNLVEATEIVPIPHLEPPEAAVILLPPIQVRPQPPAPAPAPAPAPVPALPPTDGIAPAPVLEAIPEKAREPNSFETWDTALDLVATELAGTSPSMPMPMHRVEAAMAAGALLAAWGGWRGVARSTGRSRRLPTSIAPAGLSPGGVACDDCRSK